MFQMIAPGVACVKMDKSLVVILPVTQMQSVLSKMAPRPVTARRAIKGMATGIAHKVRRMHLFTVY